MELESWVVSTIARSLALPGGAAIEFRVPESLTAWRFRVAAWTRELATGSIEREVRTAKELMVRPYLPRFLREGDRAELHVAVQNAVLMAVVEGIEGEGPTGPLFDRGGSSGGEVSVGIPGGWRNLLVHDPLAGRTNPR